MRTKDKTGIVRILPEHGAAVPIQYQRPIYRVMNGIIGTTQRVSSKDLTQPRVHLTATEFVQSSDGFSVEVLGLTGLCYREGNRQMFVDSEVFSGPSGMAVYKDTIQEWNPPHEDVPLTDSDRDGIVNNIHDASPGSKASR